MRSIDIRYLYLDIDKILNKISSNSRAYYKALFSIKCKRIYYKM